MTLGPGDRLGPYEITAALGAGGMGEVYRARDTRLNRGVAVKVLPPSFAGDSERTRRFAFEARAASALNHPNILSVFDIGTHEGRPYLVFELLEGQTLRAWLDRERLPLARAVDFARQIAAGLAAVHRQGMTHRDIKPENLFVTADGRVKILDFGLARRAASEAVTVAGTSGLTPLTGAGELLGTPGYMSPEQVRGGPTDAQSDIFSFGAVLYEMVGGVRAFKGDSAVQTMHAILEEDPPALPAPALRALPELEWIVGRCLEKEPEARFQSAHDLGILLQSIAGGPAGVPSPTVTPKRSVLRSTWPWLAIAGLALAAGALAFGRLTSPAATDPPGIETLTFSGHDSSPAASPDGNTIAFMSDRDGVPRIWLAQVSGGGEMELTEGPDDFPHIAGRDLDPLRSHHRRPVVAVPRPDAGRRTAQAHGRCVRGGLVTGRPPTHLHPLGIRRAIGLDRRRRGRQGWRGAGTRLHTGPRTDDTALVARWPDHRGRERPG